MKKEHIVSFTVRHTSTPGDRTGMLLEILRYAQVVSSAESMDGTTSTVTLYAPRCVAADRRQWWAEQNVKRINSFGPEFKAEVIVR